MEKKVILSIDAETNGLWGEIFAVGACLYNEAGEVIAKYAKRSTTAPTNEWVLDNVWPHVAGMDTVEGGEAELLADFARFYHEVRAQHEGVQTLWHMGHVVEAYLFRRMRELDFIGDWDAPYVPIEVSAYLDVVGEPADSVDSYVRKYGLEVSEGNTHNPLYDCEVAYVVYRHIVRSRV